jgi:hypothetical protein
MIGRVFWFAALVTTSAVAKKTDFVRVRALTDGRSCIVFDQQLACDAVGAYLKDTRHVPLSRAFLVDLVGGQPSMAAALKAGHSLEAAGYSDIFRVGFITEPRSSSDAKP